MKRISSYDISANVAKYFELIEKKNDILRRGRSGDKSDWDKVPAITKEINDLRHELKDHGWTDDCPIHSDLKRDIQKMIEYRQKGSNPDALASSVRDIEKAKNRYAIAKAMGWSEAEWAFRSRLRDLGLTSSEIDAIEPADLSGVSDQVNKASSVGATGRRSLPAPLDRYLRSLGLSYSMESIRPSSAALQKDYGNGRRWTIEYEIKCSNGTTFYFVNHTNEGGGSYGYSLAERPSDYALAEDLSIAECLETLKMLLPNNQAVASVKSKISKRISSSDTYTSSIKTMGDLIQFMRFNGMPDPARALEISYFNDESDSTPVSEFFENHPGYDTGYFFTTTDDFVYDAENEDDPEGEDYRRADDLIFNVVEGLDIGLNSSKRIINSSASSIQYVGDRTESDFDPDDISYFQQWSSSPIQKIKTTDNLEWDEDGFPVAGGIEVLVSYTDGTSENFVYLPDSGGLELNIDSSKTYIKSGMGYNLGFRAALEGKSIEDNPFKHGKPGSAIAKISAEWFKGFDDGCQVPPGQEKLALQALDHEDEGETLERVNGLQEMYSSILKEAHTLGIISNEELKNGRLEA